MKRKYLIVAFFACVLVLSTVAVLNTWTQNKLSVDEQRFDLDKNGELSEAEKGLMVRVMRIEDARGTQFS